VYLQSDEYMIAGTIDRIDRVTKDALCIVEYKTGKPRIRDVKRELAFYALLVESSGKYEQKVSHLAVYNPDENKFHVQEVSERLLRVAVSRLRQFRRAHEIGEFPPRPGSRCIWCPFKICEEVASVEGYS